jgi:hypothetical protein
MVNMLTFSAVDHGFKSLSGQIKRLENNKEAAYTNFLVQPTIYHTQGGHANHLLHQ